MVASWASSECRRFFWACCTEVARVDFILSLLVEVKSDDVHVLFQNRRGVPDVDGSLQVVARHHPELDTGLLHRTDSLGSLVLEHVLNSCYSEEGEFFFDFGHHAHHLLLLPVDGGLGLLVLVGPTAVEALSDLSLAQHQGTEAFLCVSLKVLQCTLLCLGVLSRVCKQVEESGVCSLTHGFDHSVGSLDDDSGSLAVGGVLDHVKELELVELALLVMFILDYDFVVLLVFLNKLDSVVLGCVDRGQVIGAGAREDGLGLFVLRVFESANIVAQGEVVQELVNLFVLRVQLPLNRLVQVAIHHVEVGDPFLFRIFTVST
eukprot:CAMPEP_0170484132 /NCGR_PEP_ID=MMETSP0208-20121228/3672_1 /TAXON_ID=197538 /ORGANISM="Strombidium inclinatum, Strain S3" /LENGTH=318 /DNA_ID=CAMNT_0010757403 /DNA_START=1156 /DNA_END=2111 /DNA_ORIENTATION=+